MTSPHFPKTTLQDYSLQRNRERRQRRMNKCRTCAPSKKKKGQNMYCWTWSMCEKNLSQKKKTLKARRILYVTSHDIHNLVLLEKFFWWQDIFMKEASNHGFHLLFMESPKIEGWKGWKKDASLKIKTPFFELKNVYNILHTNRKEIMILTFNFFYQKQAEETWLVFLYDVLCLDWPDPFPLQNWSGGIWWPSTRNKISTYCSLWLAFTLHLAMYQQPSSVFGILTVQLS